MVVLSIDGIDGSGKSTISSLLASELKDSGFVLIETSHRSDMLPAVRKLLNGNVEKYLTLRFMYYSCVNQVAANEIRNLTEAGKNVILDRSQYSTLAHHLAYDTYYGSNKRDELIALFKASEVSLIRPDIAIFLYVDETEELKRIRRRDTAMNNSLDFDSKVSELAQVEFKKIASRLRDEKIGRVCEIDTTDMEIGKVVSIVKDEIRKANVGREDSQLKRDCCTF